MKDKILNIFGFVFAIMTFGASFIRLISNKYINGFIPLSLACFLLVIHLQEYKKKQKKYPILIISIILILIGYVQILYNL